MDPIFSRLSKNAGILLTGNVWASIMGLGTLALTGRALGPERLGLLALIQAYITVVDSLFNFQSWQALIKYGAGALRADHRETFKSLIKFGLLLDAGTALVATLAAILGLKLLLWRQFVAPESAKMALIYSVVIVFHLSGTPTAILRLFNRFHLFAWQQIATSSLKCIAVIISWYSNAGLWTFLLVWMFVDVFANLLLYLLGWHTLRSNGYQQIFSSATTGSGRRFPGIWRFVWTSNLNSSIRMASRELDTLIVGSLAGAAAVGFYKVAKQFSSILGKLSDPLYQAIYPELARLWSESRRRAFRRMIIFPGLLAGSAALFIWIFVLLFGKKLLLLTVGAGFLPSLPVLDWYMLAMVLAVFSFTLQPAMLAMGKPHVSFAVQLGSSILYFMVMPLFLLHDGVSGAAAAYVIYYLVWSLLMLFFIHRLGSTD